jgi:predicted enzyme related to lactoylglutathione lyase
VTKLVGPRPQGVPCWLDLTVPDVTRAAAFYARVFGWTYDVSGPEFGHYHLALADGAAAVGLGEPMGGEGPPAAWTLYFAADDAGAMAARAEALGGQVLSPAFEVPGQGRMAIVADPGGAVFGLWQALGHTGFGVEDLPGTLAWVEVHAREAERVGAFYADLLGATLAPMPGAPSPYWTLGRDGRSMAGVQAMNPAAGEPPRWMAYLNVADVDAAVAAAAAAGGSVRRDAWDTPFGRMAELADPFGASFMVMTPPTPAA